MSPRRLKRLNVVLVGVMIAVLSLALGGFFACINNVNAEGEITRTKQQVESRRKELRQRLDNIESEIGKKRQVLQQKRKKRVSLQRDIQLLKAKIEKAQLEIKRRNLIIQRLRGEIQSKRAKVDKLSGKLDREKEAVAGLIRKMNKMDDYSLVELVLRKEDFSKFFRRLDSVKTVNEALKSSIKDMKNLRKQTQDQKKELIKKKQEQEELRKVQVLQKRETRRREKQKQELVAIARSKEKKYKNIIEQKQKTAAEIRSELFTLRDSAAIPFGKALKLTRQASGKTGVKPAFVLGILAEESKIGEYMGTGTWKEDMKPTRDKPVFKAMAREIGFDPDEMPVSKAPSYGWGGAMGPAQFIPSTWVCYGGFINTRTGDCNNKSRSLSWKEFWQGPWDYRASEDKIRQLVGDNDPSNPWNPKDAIMASAILLKNNGAAKSASGCRTTSSPEECAALRYFAGWGNADDPSYAFYGNEVMELTKKYQKQINVLENE